MKTEAYCLNSLFKTIKAAGDTFQRLLSATTDKDLQEKVETLYHQSVHQKEKLKKEFKNLSKENQNVLLEGLVDDSMNAVKFEGDLLVRDCSIIAAIQKWKHLEISQFENVLKIADEKEKNMLQNLRLKTADHDNSLTDFMIDNLLKNVENKKDVKKLLGFLIRDFQDQEKTILENLSSIKQIPKKMKEAYIEKSEESLKEVEKLVQEAKIENENTYSTNLFQRAFEKAKDLKEVQLLALLKDVMYLQYALSEVIVNIAKFLQLDNLAQKLDENTTENRSFIETIN
jgi:ferritin-like metal-binding protein YciE